MHFLNTMICNWPLDQFAKSKTNVLCDPPVNAKWMEYMGLSQEKYQQVVEKIKYQLTEQGFNIAGFFEGWR